MAISRPINPTGATRPEHYFSAYFRDPNDADPTTNLNANVDGSMTPVEFCVQVPLNGAVEITSVVITVKDATPLSDSRYGNVPPLTNGTRFVVKDDTKEFIDFFDGAPWVINRNLLSLFQDINLPTWSQGEEVLTARIRFFDRADRGILLDGTTQNLRMCFIIQDDVTGLTEHRFFASGRKILKV